MKFAEQRGPEKTFCPSEVARALYQDWRPNMEAVRETAWQMVEEGLVEITQGGVAVARAGLRGPIRIRKKGA